MSWSDTTAREEAHRAREILAAAVLITALLWGCVTSGVVLIVGAYLGHAAKLGDAYFVRLRVTAGVFGLLLLGARIWRGRHAFQLANAVLWVEERVPALQYALVTAVTTPSPPLEAIVSEHNLPRVALWAAITAYARAALAVIVAAVLLSRVVPIAPVRDATVIPTPPPLIAATPPAPASRLTPLQVLVVPPAYAHQRSTTVSDPSMVTALVGSTVTVRGPGAPAGLGVILADSTVQVVSADGGWQIEFAIPARAAALRLSDGSSTRLIVIDPKVDNPPTVVLSSPHGDVTVRTAPESINLDAEASDDIGLADGYFEYIVSTGQSEGNFKSVTGTVGRVTFGDTPTGTLHATLALGPLHLGPGSQVSIRAVAHDGNTVSGPGVGTSETRTLRLARPEEYDSLALTAAPPPPDEQTFMSQRMLVIEIEALVARRRRITHALYVQQSTRLADEEGRLRQAVDDILNGGPAGADSGEMGGVGEREDVDVAKGEAGSTSANRERAFFAVAYQAMTDAARSLGVALPDTALPPARRALVALDSARVMNRLYLRGAPPKLIVDIDRVRLKGAAGGPTDSVRPAPRNASFPSTADSVRRLVMQRLPLFVSGAPGDAPGDAAVDSLVLLQVAALRVDPTLAGVLGEAITALREGQDARPALERVRRVAAPRRQATAALAQ